MGRNCIDSRVDCARQNVISLGLTTSNNPPSLDFASLYFLSGREYAFAVKSWHRVE